jgi:hypothetical protein
MPSHVDTRRLMPDPASRRRSGPQAFRQFQYPTPPLARAGGAQAKFLAEVNAEEAERNKDLVLAEYRRYQQGEMPSGPGARDLISFFASVDGKLARAAAEDPTVVGSDQEVRALLARSPASCTWGWRTTAGSSTPPRRCA